MADVCAIEHDGNLYVFRRTNDLPTGGMFIDKSWDIAHTLCEHEQSDRSRGNNVAAISEAMANMCVNERHLGVTYARAS